MNSPRIDQTALDVATSMPATKEDSDFNVLKQINMHHNLHNLKVCMKLKNFEFSTVTLST